MAATPFDVPAPGSAYAFDIYNDAQSHAPRAPAPALPGGPCNYTDSTLPRCGCRRFWSRASLSSPVFQDAGSLAEVCMCSHHACFHEDAQPGQTQQEFAMANAPGQENQKPVVSRAPLSPVQLPSLHAPGSLGSSLDFNFLDFQASLSAARVEAANPSPAGDTHAGQDSPMPDTVTNWEELTRSPAGHARGLPPMPTQCLMSPPPPPSTSASSQARYLRPFAGKGLQTLSGVSAPRPESRRREHAEQADDPGQAPTEAAPTPEAAPSQDRPVSGLETAYQKLSERVDSHEQRLDRLETNSFSVAGHEDCHDRHENIDLRVTELESRVDEVEKILNDNGSVISSRRAPKQGGGGGADDATASVASVSTNATVLASNRAEVYNQLQQLQAQVNQLQAAALPSYVKPWELEVVFLPFPLKGIWIEAKEFANHRRSTGSNFEGWTQMPNTLSRATPDPQSPKFQEWPGQGPESNWLLPRAFAAGRIIDQRLRSRGLIKTVLVRGPDARSVHLAIHDAFEDVLRISSSSEARSALAPDYPLTEFLGLRQAWVPLRKLHKDSRLRFLSPAEMATPTLWDFTFLASSVVMKAAGAQRLYITQPEAYLQDHPLGYHAIEAGWTWQKLRQLSRVYPDSQSSADVPEADALEECWNWNDRLDGPPSVPASAISLRQSIHQRAASRRSSTEPSGQFYTGVESPILSTGHSHSHGGPSRSRAQSPLIQRDRKGSWPSSIRAGSLPPGAHPALLSPAQSRRRVSSHAALTPYERRSSPFVPRASPRLQSPRPGPVHSHNMPTSSTKRRFASRSPSLAPRNTPRWSRTSMSRSPSLAPGGLYGQNHHHHHRHHHREDENGRERRMTTPFYYATPHSEAVPEFGYHRGGSRGPVALGNGNGDAGLRVYDGYGDEDEDMAEDEGFTTTGSSGTGDEGDSEMTDRPDHPGYHRHSHQNYHHRASGRRSVERQVGNGSFGFGTDGGDDADLDIDVYEDEDELDGVDTDAGNITDHHHHHHPHHPHHPPSRHRRSRSHTTGSGGGVWHGFGRQTPSLASQQQQPLRPEDIPWAGIEDPIANGGIDLEGDSNMSDGENIDPTSQSSLSLGDDDDRGGGQITIHEDDDDEDDDDELGGMEIVGRGQGQGQGQGRRKGGKREAEKTTNNNNNDDDDDDDDDDEDGDTSSQAPSEYSSKPGPWQIIPLPTTEGPSNRGVGGSELDVGMAQKQPHMMTRGGSGSGSSSRSSVMGFRIHEDGTAGPAGPESAEGLLDTQWG
ncbi:hypothetical protein MYCTH_2302880 [Thermothelomyces thermophilus ATCC 42464]|uniref:Uncharacterized protein n=1 Tax=Thermothelomyces thermophilus (strain ATCC 42464 / BCRC 31852 / DSM 1799) TaxID=573729 RepID=G2Q8P6_THET4|nr:uncharacterized protein MYCTH_2302880 [Thermothelomyces thermophilus ATCC 42464]AEO57095.1 hypothetical protein MYCTH_2302880 [Thermothelomyces thermophilus ATCC 42464]